jgi:predicted RNA-binding Zn-ribbon protein involved in translation (DUF1610 family)
MKPCPNCGKSLTYEAPRYPEQNEKGLYVCVCGYEITDEALAEQEMRRKE